ncbi:hypothetical protein IFM89_033288 [Coptis chinensis]|uniref:Uncharacterized protein n=1 Tax=Coptis chinensis TaxID=261450 RepID=A0A835HLF1_9MAGN|nr:hypothetical protein IFM89_033288 [Coptis chinensis]
MGVEKLIASKMMLPGSNRRIQSVYRHSGMSVAGLAVDGRQIVEFKRAAHVLRDETGKKVVFLAVLRHLSVFSSVEVYEAPYRNVAEVTFRHLRLLLLLKCNFTSNFITLRYILLCSSSSFGSGEYRSRDRSSEEHRKVMKNVVDGHFRALVTQLLQVEELPVSEEDDQENWLDIITLLYWEAATLLKPIQAREGYGSRWLCENQMLGLWSPK